MILEVECPKCGYRFNTTTLRRVKCWNCGHVFKVYYKKKVGKQWYWRSRIVRIVEGSRIELMKEFEKLKEEKD